MRQVYFHQECGVCGRPMLVRIELLGERIQCGHCHAECLACWKRPKIPSEPPPESRLAPMRAQSYLPEQTE